MASAAVLSGSIVQATADPATLASRVDALVAEGNVVPVAGGIFFRLLPYAVTSRIIRSMNGRGRPAIVYLHPWEMDPDHPRVPGIPARRTWYHYHGLSRAVAKYERLLREFEFQSIKQYMSTYKSRGLQSR